ncbi:hypothetical protein FB45DRAFT_695935, partial [Roridomyces roridus]
LGHLGMTGVKSLMRGNAVEGMDVIGDTSEALCEDCLSGKQTCRPFDGLHEREKQPGERVYMDLWGPPQITGVGGKRYTV